jgi:hypothetical protein
MAMQTFDDDELTDIKPQQQQQAKGSATATAAATAPKAQQQPKPAVKQAAPAAEDFEDESKPAASAASEEDNLDTDFDDERIYHRSGQLNQCRPDKSLKAVRFAFVPVEWLKPKSAKTHFLKGLGKEEKMGRFRCLSPLGSDDQGLCCVALDKDGETTIVALVLRYLNANSEGKYIKGADGSVPPIEWELQFVRLSQFNMKQIKKLAPEDSDVFHIDIIMSLAEGRAFGYEFTAPTAGTARWLKNPQLIEEIKHSCQRFADGKVLISKLGKKLTEMEWKALLSGVSTGANEAKLDNMDEL